MAKQTLFCKTTIYDLLKKREPLFSGWRIKEFLGSGVSGCVFRMERIDLGQTFNAALKVIPLTRKIEKQSGSIETLQQSVVDDAREIVHLYSVGNHQNLVGLSNHDIFHHRSADSVTSLVAVMLEFLPNTLDDMLKEALPWQDAFKITIDCLKGLEHVHAKNIIHRDLKPGNIFIAEDGTAKIGDFGVAKKMSEHTYAETRVGTPLYIAPEILVESLSSGYDHQADVYSMGLVLFEMLTGTLPLDDECNGNRNCMVNRRLAGEPFSLRRSLPPGVTKSVLGSLAYQPSKRYETAKEFREALELALATDGRETNLPKGAFLDDKPKENANQARSSYGEGMGDSTSRPGKRMYDEYKPSYNSEPSALDSFASSGINASLKGAPAIIAFAILACALAFATKKLHFMPSIFYIVAYLVLPLYIMLINFRLAALAGGAFILSICAETVLFTGTIKALFPPDTITVGLILIYLVFIGVFTLMGRNKH